MIMSRINPKITGCYESEGELRRGPWTLEEDNLLIQYITCHGEGNWNSLAKFAGLKRTGKSCRLRWLNYLKPDIKRGNLTPHEQLLILELHSKWGNRWSKIAQNLPGRTDNEIKNYWRTRVQKQARQLKVDSNSSKFLEAIRTFWMPRLLEKIEQNSSPVTSSSPSSSTFVTQNCYNNIITATTSVSDQPADVVTNSDSNFQLPAQNLTAGKYQSENPVEDNNNNFCQVGFPSYEMGGRDTLLSERHVSGVDWLGEDLGCTFWNTDELWHFRG